MKKKNSSISVIFEGLWLTVAIASLALGIHATFNSGGLKNSFTFFIITLVSILLYYMRRSLRLKKND